MTATAMLSPSRSDTFFVPDTSLPLRKGDLLFVVALVMLALVVPSRAVAALLIAVSVSAWIRFRVFGGRARRNDP
jgi:hypothetical protein